MTRRGVLVLAAIFFVTSNAWAVTRSVRCGIGHNVRTLVTGGEEIRTAVIIFDNGDLQNATTIDRLTIRDFFGDVVHDSGPAIEVAHPLNRDFGPIQDITVVPPGASFYIATNHIWRASPIPEASTVPGIDGNERGFNMSVVVQFSKEEDPNLFRVHGRFRSRERVKLPDGTFRMGTEFSSNDLFCFRLPD